MTPESGLENFRYVVMAARRARQLQNGSQPLVASSSTKACRVAQEEIAAGMVKAAAPVPDPISDSNSVPNLMTEEVTAEPELPQETAS